MRAFHLAWLSLFSCFFSTFSIPPLTPIIREDLKLTDVDIGNAGIASFLGAIFSRLAMGPVCDVVGPRVASATLSLLTAPVVLCVSLVGSPNSFILVRFLIGFSLANFVSNQFWMSSMFSSSVVGRANGFAAGWASVGSGVTQLVMPLVYTFMKTTLNLSPPTAWRCAFIVPALFQTLTALMVLIYGQDTPDENYKLRNNLSDDRTRENFFEILFDGLKNYRGWILGLVYGCSFGMELTTDNIIAQYFYDRFGVNIEAAGAIAASFGLANCFTRPAGGVVSDAMGARFGMRGRLWALWVVQTVAGLLCVLIGRVNSLWSLGVISGMTGSGGTMGAVVTQMFLFSGSSFPKQTSISLMGVMMIVFTLPVTFIYFPQRGGIFCAPSLNPNSLDEDYSLLE